MALMRLPVSPDDWRLRHKTSDRGFYDAARRGAGVFEVVFFDGEGRLTEGSFTNVFVERDGRLLTPPLARGLLPGVLRARLIAEGRAVEADLTASDLRRWFLHRQCVARPYPGKACLTRKRAAPAGPPLFQFAPAVRRRQWCAGAWRRRQGRSRRSAAPNWPVPAPARQR